MFDCHCHILPGIDDGSKNVQMSLNMLDMEVRQGVKGVIFTPHFYADMMSPATFLDRRARSLEKLEAELSRLAGKENHILEELAKYSDEKYEEDMLQLVYEQRKKQK